jgi:hypothetical protein
MIDRRNRVAGRLGNRPEHLPRRVQQAFGAELCADERDTHRNLPHNIMF